MNRHHATFTHRLEPEEAQWLDDARLQRHGCRQQGDQIEGSEEALFTLLAELRHCVWIDEWQKNGVKGCAD